MCPNETVFNAWQVISVIFDKHPCYLILNVSGNLIKDQEYFFHKIVVSKALYFSNRVLAYCLFFSNALIFVDFGFKMYFMHSLFKFLSEKITFK